MADVTILVEPIESDVTIEVSEVKNGTDGVGLPIGGATGQVPIKQSATDYDIAYGFIGVDNLANELKKVFTVTDIIDWKSGVTGIRTFTGTPTVVFTDTNAPTETKTITIDLTGEVTSIAFPANYKKATNASEDYAGTKINKFTFEYVNGVVYYSNTLFDV